jgi:hypothetical protein
MSGSDGMCSAWADNQFWDQLETLESRHQKIQSEHETVRRGLESVRHEEAAELRRAWQRYCDVIAELDRATADFETLRTHAR